MSLKGVLVVFLNSFDEYAFFCLFKSDLSDLLSSVSPFQFKLCQFSTFSMSAVDFLIFSILLHSFSTEKRYFLFNQTVK